MPSKLKQKLRERSSVFGGWTSLGHPSITEIFARSGMDFIGIDLEHSTISQEQSQRIIAACQAAGVACLPRLTSHNPDQIKQLLDSGADGIIVPNVFTSEEVERIVEWSKYPPIGKRSYGIARGQGYGFDFDRYTKEWNERGIIIIQIESIQAIKSIDDLLSHEAVDGAMIGPYDLSGSLGIPGQITSPKVLEACKIMVEACQRHGKACGTQVVEPTSANVEEMFSSGYTFGVMASDIFVLWKWSQRMKDLIGNSKSKKLLAKE